MKILNKSISESLRCEATKYCPEGTSDIAMDTLTCTAGYYCPIGSDRELKCPMGYKCPTADMETPIICENGELCDELGLQAPKNCPVGYKCPQVTCTSQVTFEIDDYHSYNCMYACTDTSCPIFKVPCGKGGLTVTIRNVT